MGIVRNLHWLRQVRARLPYGSTIREGPRRRRDAQEKAVPAVSDAHAGEPGMTATMTMTKKRLATVWLDGCSGCHMSFLDMDERLIELAGKVDLVYSPLVDIKEFPADVDIALIEGAV